MTTTFVGIGEIAIGSSDADVLTATNLGSCLGITAYDPAVRVGGMIHCLLPLSKSNEEKASQKPCTYVDTGFLVLLQELFKRGAQKQNLVITVVGGANINDTGNVFEIGKKNYTVFRKLMWKNGLLIKAEHVGESISRTVSLNLGSGEVWLKTGSELQRLA